MASTTLFTILNNKTKALTANVIIARTRTYCFIQNPVKRDCLHSRINAIGRPSCSVVPVLQQWVEDGKTVNEFQLQRIIRDLRSRRRFIHALEVNGADWFG